MVKYNTRALVASNPRGLANPNDPLLVNRRKAFLRDVNAELIDDRADFLEKRVRDKDVLDVGCVNHTAMNSDDPGWLHARLARSARTCLGADVLASDVESLRGKGYEAIELDITQHFLDRRFDVIVCGEVIEHVSNPVALFANCRSMLNSDGQLFLTTPNPWYADYILKSLFAKYPVVDSVEHVAWYDPGVLTQLAEMNGFRLVAYHGIRVTTTASMRARMFFALMQVWRLLGVRKEVFAKSILYEFQPIIAAKGAAP